MTRLPRILGLLSLTVAAALALAAPAQAADERIEPTLGDDGLYHQDWFVNSFLDLQEDLTTAAEAGKRYAIVFEQKGCPYCKDLHTVNFADPETNAYIRERFDILQLNLWGNREVTDFDGEVLEEKALAQKYNVNFTPTIVFFPEDPAAVAGKGGTEAELARMPGYFRPFHFLSMFEWVHDKRYDQDQSFQRYILEKANARDGMESN